ncbi:alkaline phosphatase [Pseudoduganella ginsengisoli]|uniref:Sulfatase-like hydrolase/transferase n=1 Tax=Pseudoduganella ginsengisoli TaxID=1462440 RepID=A0A6L6Q7U8_9BURK|nr:alkaline phosphatase [Pseudoduganella ginsengisoli]MTW05341.1 sulfatase-like hydrolase/transferase [Pseudoduganella ginsengisoli]
MSIKPLRAAAGVFVALALAACGKTSPGPDAPGTPSTPAPAPKNVIFFLGDGMGLATMTAARIYSVGEDGELTMDTLPETAFVKTFSNDAQVTDSAPSMSAYMTGIKMNNEVISMSSNTTAVAPIADANGNKLGNNCGTNNGTPATTLLELAKAKGYAAGVVTTTRITHATPAATYAHICHRDLENDIAAAMVPGGAGYNSALGTNGIDVVLGGGSQFFIPFKDGGKRADGRNLINEMKAKNYTVASNAAEFNAIDGAKTDRLFGLFTSSHMSYDLDRDPAKEPSLADMTTKAMDVLSKNTKGYFLMVEGGRIDHALHETTAKKALQDTVAFDNAIKAAIAKAKLTDPDLKNTLIVVTADHDHTLVLNGYAKRTGKTSASNAGVLGTVKNYVTGATEKDLDGAPYSIIGFGNGENRTQGNRSAMASLDDSVTSANTYHQEAIVRVTAGNETHGGTDVFLGAIGMGSDTFLGTIDNTRVNALVKSAAGL